jgi:hypothetical protein
MRTPLFIICCLFISTGCKDKNRIPAAIIPQKKMQAVVWDMMRADQFLTDFVPKDTSLDKGTERMKLYSQVFAIHKISKEQYEESFSFYRRHLDLFKVLMDSLSHPKQEAPTEMVKPPVVRDSLQQPLPNTPRTDSLLRLKKKKGRKLIKAV